MKKRISFYSTMFLLMMGMTVITTSGNRLQGQNPPPPSQTRPTIGVFNLAKVIRNYDFAKNEMKKYEERVKLANQLAENFRKELGVLEAKAKAETSLNKKDELDSIFEQKQSEFKKFARHTASEMESLKSETFKQTYKDIHLLCKEMAPYYGFDLIVGYNDTIDEGKRYSNETTSLMLFQTLSMRPFYVRKNIDLTDIMVKVLNERRPVATKPGPNTGTPPPNGNTPPVPNGVVTPPGKQ